MFRHERPQKGRFRQFTQFNVEALGFSEAMIDAEQIVMLAQLLDRLGVKNVEIHLNSLGDDQCRPVYKNALIEYLEQHENRLCEDCQRRMRENPLRVLDCKQEGCKTIAANAPTLSTYWCDDCRAHFEEVQAFIQAAGVKYTVDPRLVRGLDYYTRTTFEALAGDLGAQNAVAGGGRYDNLIKELGGPDTPATGFAVGVERLSMLVDEKSVPEKKPDYFFAALGPETRREEFAKATELRRAGFWVEMDPSDRGLKAQMKKSAKAGVVRTEIVGENERNKGSVLVKDMASGEQQEIPGLSSGVWKVLPSDFVASSYSSNVTVTEMKDLYTQVNRKLSAWDLDLETVSQRIAKEIQEAWSPLKPEPGTYATAKDLLLFASGVLQDEKQDDKEENQTGEVNKNLNKTTTE
jgi:histidyl-tRNA synthetase